MPSFWNKPNRWDGFGIMLKFQPESQHLVRVQSAQFRLLQLGLGGIIIVKILLFRGQL